MSEARGLEDLNQQEFGDAGTLNIRTEIQERYRTHPENWFHWVFDRFHLPDRAIVLELGGGAGDLWVKNLEHLPAGWQLVYSDLSLGMALEARRRLQDWKALQPAVLDAQALPFLPNQFDAVIGIGLLDLVPQRRAALDEVLRVLKPGGKFYLSAGGRTHLQEIENLVKPFLPDADYGGDPERFGLENGVRLLAPWFEQVTKDHYQDELVFRSPEPIEAYVRSEQQVAAALSGEKLAAFRQFVQSELALRGQIRVTVDKGLFEARKAPG